MRFEFDGKKYQLEFPRRDVPQCVNHPIRGEKPTDAPVKMRRETSARLLVQVGTDQHTADGRLYAPVWAEVMRATVRRYFKDAPWSNERARQAALDRLLTFVPDAMHGVIRAAYFTRERGKVARRKQEARIQEKAARVAGQTFGALPIAKVKS